MLRDCVGPFKRDFEDRSWICFRHHWQRQESEYQEKRIRAAGANERASGILDSHSDRDRERGAGYRVYSTLTSAAKHLNRHWYRHNIVENLPRVSDPYRSRSG